MLRASKMKQGTSPCAPPAKQRNFVKNARPRLGTRPPRRRMSSEYAERASPVLACLAASASISRLAVALPPISASGQLLLRRRELPLPHARTWTMSGRTVTGSRATSAMANSERRVILCRSWSNGSNCQATGSAPRAASAPSHQASPRYSSVNPWFMAVNSRSPSQLRACSGGFSPSGAVARSTLDVHSP